MNFKHVISAVLCALLLPVSVYAEKPKIALVLSGGGAKGFAEIPIIEALESEGIFPDMILGTSIGSLIGAMYAAGYTPKEIRSTLLSMDFMTILNERPATPEKIPPEAFSKKTDGLSFSFSDGKFGSAPGLVGDQKILCELTNHLCKVADITDFDRLFIPFRAVAVNAVTGEQIIIKSGSLTRAVRASISIPAVFTPAPTENNLYAMDGGLRNNLPVQIAKEMGADIVIAVDVASVVDTDPKTLSDFYSIAVQIFNLVISSNAVEQYEYADFVFKPDLSSFSTFDFQKPSEIVRAGERCVEQNREKIKQLARQIESAGGTLKKLDYNREGEYSRLPDPFISRVSVRDISFTEPVPIPSEKDFEKFTGRKLDGAAKKQLAKKLDRLKERYHLSSLVYSLSYDEDGAATLEILANHYEQKMNHIFFSGFSSVSVTNYKPQKYLAVSPDFTIGVFLRSPLESLFRLSFGNTTVFDTEFFPRIFRSETGELNLDLKASAKYGSCSPQTSNVFNEKESAEDRGMNFFGGIRFKHTDYFSAKAGIAYSADKINSTNEWHNTSYLHNEIIFTSLHNNYIMLYGEKIEALLDISSKNKNSAGNPVSVYNLRFSAEKRFEILDEKNSAGISYTFCSNRFPYELNSGYCDFGGTDGMCGYPSGTLRRDFSIAGISFRQKLMCIASMPLFAVAETKVSVSSGYDPFIHKEEPPDSLFSDKKVETGAGLFLALHTPLGNLVFGGSMNSDLDWYITLGLR
ncbi:patatin-like phospholipase family protein [Treponema sp.]|uniref:patatin-like phospholipase family protein n=1 Tax=Treponema sp. TaxID=166 RepID=UPI003F0C4A94